MNLLRRFAIGAAILAVIVGGPATALGDQAPASPPATPAVALHLSACNDNGSLIITTGYDGIPPAQTLNGVRDPFTGIGNVDAFASYSGSGVHADRRFYNPGEYLFQGLVINQQSDQAPAQHVLPGDRADGVITFTVTGASVFLDDIDNHGGNPPIWPVQPGAGDVTQDVTVSSCPSSQPPVSPAQVITSPPTTTTAPQPTTTTKVKASGKTKLYTTVCRHYSLRVHRHGKTIKVGKWSCVRYQPIGRGNNRRLVWVTLTKLPKHPELYPSPGRVWKP